MKIKHTIAAVAATTLATNAATVLVNHGDPSSGNHTDHAGPFYGQSITSAATANSLDDVTFQVRDGGGGQSVSGTTAFLQIYTGTTFNTSNGAITSLGTFIGVSDNAVNNSSDATDLSALTWNFTNQAVTGNTVYNFMFSTVAAEGSLGDLTQFTDAATGLELVTGNPYLGGNSLVANNFHTNGLGWDLNFAANFNTDVVPEPSSTALLGLGGLALILRRRK